ncbi:hypothetical protein HYW44_04705 [Candidatus Daviesbacteria bacterium]|nr:hypothetical protein [Candidatus Daviesbacteria bacterium]
MQKIYLTYTSFVVACLAVIAAFITATTYLQLTVAILLYPVLIFFAYKALPLRTKKQFSDNDEIEVEFEPVPPPDENVTVIQRNSVGISDIDKRAFLKLIGGAGITLFLFSIFNKKAEGLFFKNIPPSGASGSVSLQDLAGNKIDPARSQPTDGYRISEIDDNVITFYGFTNKDGAWFVMREDTDNGSFRYAKGDSNFSGNWIKRENLKYDYYSNIF